MKAILRFTLENFRSISERKTILLTPKTHLSSQERMVVSTAGDICYLKSAAIYGANSSGKSNLIKGIGLMRSLIVNSVKINNNEELPFEPFALNLTNEKIPTLFELEFLISEGHYRYGFTFTKEEICEEWLYSIIDSEQELPLFIRNQDGIGVNTSAFQEGEGLESKTNANRLFLSLVGQLGGNLSNSIIAFFDKDLNPISGIKTDGYNSFSTLMLNKHLPGYSEMKAFFKKVKLGFSDLDTHVREFDPHDLPSDMPSDLRERIIQDLKGKHQIDVTSFHGVYSDQGERLGSLEFNFDEMESEGTKKLFDLAGPLFDILKSGSILVVDELDAKMHPLMSQELVMLFNNPQTNPNGAQILFTTHDTNLLSSRLLDRDQIWFTEKDNQERTDLYCLDSIRHLDGSILEDTDYMERNYIQGRYGAIPYFN